MNNINDDINMTGNVDNGAELRTNCGHCGQAIATSDTPETDAEAFYTGIAADAVDANFARRLERERDEARRERDELCDALKTAMARAYARGYQHGHEDTVDGCFMIVRGPDVLDVFADDVRQMLLDGSQPEVVAALASVKGGEA